MSKKLTERTSKVGLNRGRPRVWIEGKLLVDAGFKVGDKFFIMPSLHGFYIRKSEKTATHDRTVCGKGDKPIIDLAGAIVEPLGEPGTRLKLKTTKAGTIRVSPEVE